MEVKETQYQGYLFRSRTEARWAVFFDALNIEWEYEKEGYNLGFQHGCYLPDFWLPEIYLFAEVKPNHDIPDHVRNRIEYFRKNIQSAAGLIYLFGVPDETNAEMIAGPYGIDRQHFIWAVDIARSAQFEHGKKPNVGRMAPALDLSGIHGRASCSINQFDRRLLNRTITLAGEILTIQVFSDKNQRDMARMEIGDTTGICTVTIFADAYTSLKHRIREGRVVLVKGKAAEYKEDMCLWANALQCINLPKSEPKEWAELEI